MKLNKTTIIIWSDPEITDPSQFELSALAREAEEGLAYCSVCKSAVVEDAKKDPDWDGTEFFNTDEEK